MGLTPGAVCAMLLRIGTAWLLLSAGLHADLSTTASLTASDHTTEQAKIAVAVSPTTLPISPTHVSEPLNNTTQPIINDNTTSVKPTEKYMTNKTDALIPESNTTHVVETTSVTSPITTTVSSNETTTSQNNTSSNVSNTSANTTTSVNETVTTVSATTALTMNSSTVLSDKSSQLTTTESTTKAESNTVHSVTTEKENVTQTITTTANANITNTTQVDSTVLVTSRTQSTQQLPDASTKKEESKPTNVPAPPTSPSIVTSATKPVNTDGTFVSSNEEQVKALSSGSVAAITVIAIVIVLIIFGGVAFWKIRHSSYGRLLEDQDYGSLGNYNNPLYDDS